MDFSLTDEQQAVARPRRARSSPTSVTPRARCKALEAGGRAALRPRRCGRSSPRPACSASPCPRTSAAAASASSRSACIARAGRPHAPRRSRCSPTVVLGALPIAEFGTAAQRAGAAARRASPASRSSPPRSSSSAPTRRPGHDAPGATATAGASTASKLCVPAGELADRDPRARARDGRRTSACSSSTRTAPGVTHERAGHHERPARDPRSRSTAPARRRRARPTAGGAAIVDWIERRATAGAVRASPSASARRRCA